MSSDLVIVHYNGQWRDEVTYEGYEVCGIFHKETERLKDLREVVEKMMEKESTYTCLKLQYQTKEGYKPITISNEMSLQFYKALKRKDPDYSRYPICASLEPKQTLVLRLTDLLR
ncbi:glutamate--tRNA ligase [Striga asiatica]|uniref:Glutamate--tRNA ligase n=1 Tax=Striga asiatica TaxID=4170 RepID=A0A5A7PV64_STRAF|nr:glutamate--tRNA ligase [Striga asiatica]